MAANRGALVVQSAVSRRTVRHVITVAIVYVGNIDLKKFCDLIGSVG
ncbi:MAG: hypothetical protein AAB328_15745 [candidate division NC10 bacterium]